MKILFVCMGNICRSPMAEGYFRQLLAESLTDLEVMTDSAGTHGFHVGAPPDERAQAAARRRGFDISASRARQVITEDFERFDYVLAMDRDNLEYLQNLADEAYHDRIRLLLDFSRQHAGADVPDPYYGGTTGFERVLDLLEQASEGLLAELERAVRKKTASPGQ